MCIYIYTLFRTKPMPSMLHDPIIYPYLYTCPSEPATWRILSPRLCRPPSAARSTSQWCNLEPRFWPGSGGEAPTENTNKKNNWLWKLYTHCSICSYIPCFQNKSLLMIWCLLSSFFSRWVSLARAPSTQFARQSWDVDSFANCQVVSACEFQLLSQDVPICFPSERSSVLCKV